MAKTGGGFGEDIWYFSLEQVDLTEMTRDAQEMRHGVRHDTRPTISYTILHRIQYHNNREKLLVYVYWTWRQAERQLKPDYGYGLVMYVWGTEYWGEKIKY